jgi:hypothetical protein
MVGVLGSNPSRSIPYYSSNPHIFLPNFFGKNNFLAEIFSAFESFHVHTYEIRLLHSDSTIENFRGNCNADVRALAEN